MNKFDQIFFQKYVTSDVKILSIIHQHLIIIIDKIILNYFFGVLIPSFLYFYSDRAKELVPFFVLEIFLLIMFIKIMYDIFDWYNDVWIITDEWVTDLDWSLFSTNTVSVKYRSIEWLELVQEWFINTIIWKWDIVIHKIWWENFILENSSKPYEAIEQIDSFSKKIKESEIDENQEWWNFDVIVKALSSVVEEYLWKGWYKKNDEKETKELIEKTQKQKWTIDIR